MTMKQVFIINGSGGVGKDTFIEMIPTFELFDKDFDKNEDCSMWIRNLEIRSYSSVDKVKEIARAIGWDGEKTERNRKFLSDLKLLTTEYNDMPLNDMKKYAKDFMSYKGSFDNDINRILFLHIREPEEIARAVNEFKEYNAKTILVKRDCVKHITSNMADENVFNYDYDIVIDNSGTAEELAEKAKCFLYDFLNDTLKNKY